MSWLKKLLDRSEPPAPETPPVMSLPGEPEAPAMILPGDAPKPRVWLTVRFEEGAIQADGHALGVYGNRTVTVTHPVAADLVQNWSLRFALEQIEVAILPHLRAQVAIATAEALARAQRSGEAL